MNLILFAYLVMVVRITDYRNVHSSESVRLLFNTQGVYALRREWYDLSIHCLVIKVQFLLSDERRTSLLEKNTNALGNLVRAFSSASEKQIALEIFTVVGEMNTYDEEFHYFLGINSHLAEPIDFTHADWTWFGPTNKPITPTDYFSIFFCVDIEYLGIE